MDVLEYDAGEISVTVLSIGRGTELVEEYCISMLSTYPNFSRVYSPSCSYGNQSLDVGQRERKEGCGGGGVECSCTWRF